MKLINMSQSMWPIQPYSLTKTFSPTLSVNERSSSYGQLLLLLSTSEKLSMAVGERKKAIER